MDFRRAIIAYNTFWSCFFLFSVTIISGLFMFGLFCMELNFYLTTEIHPELFVDTSKGQKLKINIDVTFPTIGCSCKNVSLLLFTCDI